MSKVKMTEEQKEKKRASNKKYRETYKEQIRDWHKANKEELKAKKKIYYQENKEKIKFNQRVWNKDNKEEIKIKNKQYYEENKDERLADAKEYYQENKEEVRDRNRNYYEENKEELIAKANVYSKENYDKTRAKRLKNDFNILVNDYDKILAFQNGVCAICLNPPKKKKLAVDHDHKTGLIRALLYNPCNTALGMYEDSVAVLERAILVLKNPPASLALGEARYGKIK